MSTLNISQLARRTCVPATTLRYYEKIGVMPATSRSGSGYRLYDEAALARVAFIQRAKALGVELEDMADLVRLWDGDECAPVQERLREMVHAKRSTTRQLLDELTHLAADLDAVGASIGDAACGPDCACVAPSTTIASTALPIAPERLIGAACTLNSEEVRDRLKEWRALRDRAASVEPIAGGVRLSLATDEPVGPVAHLVAKESECCSFYTFTLTIDGPTRRLGISAGPGGEPAVRALIGLDQ